jgi:hypothetical protein
MSRRRMIEDLLNAYENAISAGDPEECAKQFCMWTKKVELALGSAGMANEQALWRSALETLEFFPDENSFSAQSESMKAILIGFLANEADDESLVNLERLDQLRGSSSERFDLARLIKLCEELNYCFANGCYLAVTMLTRTVLNHIPPVFGCGKFEEVASNYAGGSSFRKSMQTLLKSSKSIADSYLHQQIRSRESLPNRTQVNFSNDLDILLGEVVRLMSNLVAVTDGLSHKTLGSKRGFGSAVDLLRWCFTML